MTIREVGGRDSAIKTDKQHVVEYLERALEQIESGEIEPNMMLLVLVNHDISNFTFNLRYVGRALTMLGVADCCKQELRADIGVGE